VKQSPNKFDVRVRKTRSGLGLVSFSCIKKGETIIEYIGHRISKRVSDTLNNKYIFNVSANIDIDGSPRFNTARYINHSCRPNCEAINRRNRIFIVAKRAIKSEEELTYDYGKEYFEAFIQPSRCRCEHCFVA
jgi:SET domain-containing protein